MSASRRPQVHRSFIPAIADRRGGPDALPAIVLCPGLVQNRFSFVSPTRSLPALFNRQGWCSYIVEPHGRQRDVTGPRNDSFADVVERDLAPTVEELLERHPRVAFVGHSLGGLLGVALPPALSGRLAALVTIGTPLGRLAHPAVGALTLKAARAFHRRGTPFHGPWFGRAFQILKPLMNAKHSRFPLALYAPGSMHPVDLDHFLKNSWAQDSFGLVADLLELLQSRGERAGEIAVGARLAQLRTPLLTLGGDLDRLAPPAAVRALQQKAGSAVKECRIFNLEDDGAHFGHMDLLLGRRAPEVVWPVARSFLARYLDRACPKE